MRPLLLATAAALAVGLGSAAVTFAQSQTAGTPLRDVASFSRISDPQARSVALFGEIGKVLEHPRCMNCHPASDRPRQTDARRPHQPLVVRGPDGHGAPGLQCATCHGAQNYDPARVPGNPHWALAPASMAWEGKSLGQICAQLKDPARNGNRDLAALVKHVTTDSLVLWGWDPGEGREPAPGTNAQFGALVQAWVDTGAACPPS
ncbi:Isoquinoline 1-oxidoreductase subunit [Aquabacter sp. CN5-332]|uniref:Isoquinoline 1-oxidoreductase subunit n=1 Tax=Aquabacter sp. CN5-332 TaxID=3156608 RepID=UPI0032B4C052